MALDWVYAPYWLYFPAMPLSGYAGTYYRHPTGTHYGEYIAWDESYYSFYYTIECNEGDKGFLFCRGDDGADRYYDMWLYSWGPELYHFDASLQGMQASKTVTLNPKITQEEAKALSLALQPSRERSFANQTARLDSSAYDLDHPEPYLYEKSGPGFILRIEGTGYRLKQAP